MPHNDETTQPARRSARVAEGEQRETTAFARRREKRRRARDLAKAARRKNR